MNKNIQSLIKACEELEVEYSIHHGTNNLVSVGSEGSNYVFVNWTTPLNSQSISQLCQDKDYFHSFFSDVIRMPVSLSFLTPYCDEKYFKYLEYKTINEIINKSESKFKYPMIVKKNRGSLGSNVFKATDRTSLERSLIDIFSKNSSEFDYIGLVQEYIDIKDEYRVIFVNGEYVFSYQKIIEEANFSGNLSPLHWENSSAEIITDNNLIKRIKEFCKPMFNKLNIPYCGLDIAIDTNNELFLIEANSSPGFNHVIESCGDDNIIDMYKVIIKQLHS